MSLPQDASDAGTETTTHLDPRSYKHGRGQVVEALALLIYVGAMGLCFYLATQRSEQLCEHGRPIDECWGRKW